MTVFVSFSDEFPDVEEIRHIIMPRGGPGGIPAGRYSLNETYCADPDCDCRRVRFVVVDMEGEPFAELAYAFDQPLKEAADPTECNPMVEPLADEGDYDEPFLGLLRKELARDPGYKGRLEAHYHEMKARMRERVADPDDPLSEQLAEDDAAMEALGRTIARMVALPGTAGAGMRLTPGASRKRAAAKKRRKNARDARKRNRR